MDGWFKFMINTGVVRIPRSLIKQREDFGSTALHVFCDLSKKGYGAVAYASRGPANKTSYGISLLSKFKMVPIKPITIPRLVLSPEVLGVKFRNMAKRALSSAVPWYCLGSTFFLTT